MWLVRVWGKLPNTGQLDYKGLCSELIFEMLDETLNENPKLKCLQQTQFFADDVGKN